jgi:hypothetical protein
MKRFVTTTGLFFLFIFTGALWLSLTQYLPVEISRNIVAVALGLVFALMFLWELVGRLRLMLAGSGRRWLQLALTAANVLLLLTAFAVVYRRIGLTDTTAVGSPIVHDFWRSAYLSVVTFTTLGYGDMQPTGIGRAVACIESFTGYLVLGILASTGASLLERSGQRVRERHSSDAARD